MGTPKSIIKGTMELVIQITVAETKGNTDQRQKQANARNKQKPLKIW